MTVWFLEDEAAFAKLFQEKLRQQCDVALHYVWLQNLDDALVQAEQEVPDVLVADIQLKGENGIDAARVLLDRFPALKVIFLTGNPGASHDIYDVVQPYSVRHKSHDPWKHLSSDLQKITMELDSNAHRLQTALGGKAIDLPFRDIIHIFHMRNDTYLRLHNRNEIRLRAKLDDLMPLLDSRFVRCSKSDIVNLDYVTGMEGTVFLLSDTAPVPISRSYNAAAAETFHVRKGGLF